jgi:hypothetical protein
MATVDSHETHGRVEDFKREIAEMKLRDPATARDRLLLRGGVALMVVGVGIAIVAYFASHNTTNPLLQNDMVITSVIGLALTVVGAALFLRFSTAQFLRFWLARLSYEQNHQTDRVVDALTDSSLVPK